MYRKLTYGVKSSLWLSGAVGPQAVAGRHSIEHTAACGRGVFSEGGGWWPQGGVIAPVGEKLLFEHTKFSATRGGGWSPLPPHPLYPPLLPVGYKDLSLTLSRCVLLQDV